MSWPRRRRGFSLIEVLMATLVLGLFLSIAFATQAGSVVLESRARLEAAASAAIRCKMAEIELDLAKEGFPATDEAESGDCCEIAEDDRFECSWSIMAIELPAIESVQAAMQEKVQDQSLVATGDDKESSSFQEQAEAFLSMGALSRILPVIQGFMRDAIRKVEITIAWKYRNVTYSFSVVQYLTNPSQGPLGALLQQDLVQRLMTGGNAALFDLLFGDTSGGQGGGTI